MKHIIYGLQSISTLLQTHPEKINELYFLKTRQDEKVRQLIYLAHKNEITITFTSKEILDELSKQGNHQGLIAICKSSEPLSEKDLVQMIENLNHPAFFLILDNVQDPHNLGACLRTADAAGVNAVIAPKDKSASITPTVSKVASGAAETIPFIQVTNLARTMQYLKDNNIWLFGAAHDTNQSLYQANFRLPVAIVLGSEGSGMRRLTRENCDEVYSIPMQGSVESLNVSVAAAIFMYEAVRQRNIL